jgi:hypothetical protein
LPSSASVASMEVGSGSVMGGLYPKAKPSYMWVSKA